MDIRSNSPGGLSISNRLRDKARALKSPIPEEKGPRILIVDDIFFNVDILRDVLQKVLKIDVKSDLEEAYNGK